MNPNFSPADSLLSGPSDAYPSLFDHNDNNSPTVTALTPRSLDESEREFSGTPQPQSSSDATEKKAVKKRKSWGQELPTPKTNLPPRKRAKTEDEKEQRRIERVLRNRAAAQSSRERKRKEVEGLEDEKREIERASEGLAMRLRQAELENHSLRETVAKMAAEMTVFRKMIKPSDLPTPDQSSKTTSPSVASTLFQDSAVPQLKSEFDELDFALPPPQSTVDPRDAAFASPSSGSPKADPTATSPDLTQHPAAMLCDLQCQSGDTRPPWGPVSSELSTLATPSPRRAFLLTLTMMTQVLYMSMVSAVYSRVLFPTAAIFHSLTTASAPSPPTMAQLRATLSPLIRSPLGDYHRELHALHDSSALDPPDLFAATTPGLQPCFGAPITGRDGPGIAADV
ncbi:MAG: hypothetical protein M1838_004105 [Thelocarpon superellum]|nr:MAG: hypothetical protein M1838_004105 [Thelocarpon superellum]